MNILNTVYHSFDIREKFETVKSVTNLEFKIYFSFTMIPLQDVFSLWLDDINSKLNNSHQFYNKTGSPLKLYCLHYSAVLISSTIELNELMDSMATRHSA